MVDQRLKVPAADLAELSKEDKNRHIPGTRCKRHRSRSGCARGIIGSITRRLDFESCPASEEYIHAVVCGGQGTIRYAVAGERGELAKLGQAIARCRLQRQTARNSPPPQAWYNFRSTS